MFGKLYSQPISHAPSLKACGFPLNVYRINLYYVVSANVYACVVRRSCRVPAAAARRSRSNAAVPADTTRDRFKGADALHQHMHSLFTLIRTCYISKNYVLSM